MAYNRPTYKPGDLIEKFSGEEWSALYHNGVLVEGSMGDSYHADEALFAMVGGIYYSAEDGYDHTLGENYKHAAAQTTQEIFDFKEVRDEKLARAAELRAQAAALEAEAEGLTS